MNRILVTGGSSYLGRHLVPLALGDPANEVGYTYFQNDPLALAYGRRLNILDETAVLQLGSRFRPDVIIHTTGSNRGADFDAVIRQGAANVVRLAAATNARLIHLSTDVIFDGKSPPYSETSRPNPVNDYGQAKAAAETIVSTLENHVIVRTSLIYGLAQMDHGTRWMAKALREKQPVTLFSNQQRNPVWVDTLSRACLELGGSGYTGTVNIAGSQVVSRAEFALKMLDWWQVAERDSLSIGPSKGEHWPLDCRLELSLAASLLKTPLPGVDEVIKRHNAAAANKRDLPTPH